MVLLRVALGTLLRIGNVAKTYELFSWPLPIPLPLDVTNGLEAVLKGRRHDKPHDVTALSEQEVERGIEQAIAEIRQECDDEPDEVVAPGARLVQTRRESIGAWIEAGEMIREAREVVRRGQENEAQAQATAARKRSWIGRLWPWGRARVADVAGTLPSWRHAKLVEVLEKEFCGPHSHPSFWCADQAGPLRLTVASFQELMPGTAVRWMDLDQPASSRRTCLELLIGIAGTYRKVTTESGERDWCPHDTFQRWRKSLVADARRLLNSPCSSDSSTLPTERTVKLWERKIVRDGDIALLAGPLLVMSPTRRLLAKGLVMVPGIEALVARMRDWGKGMSAEAGVTDSQLALARTIERVSNGLMNAEALRLSPKAPRAASAVAEALMSRARLLTTVDWLGMRANQASAPASCAAMTPAEKVRLALMLEGVFISTSTDDTRLSRRIPWRGQSAAANEAAQPSLELRIPGATFPVGLLAEAARCTRKVFDAIDDLDWRLWAMDQTSNVAKDWLSGESREILVTLLDKFDRDGWEVRKRKILSSDEDPQSVGDFVTSLISDSRALTLVLNDSTNDLKTAVLEDIRGCVASLLERLHAIDPERLGGLDPPRLVSGDVDVFRWSTRCRRDASQPVLWKAAWRCDPKPFGTHLEETCTDSRTVTVTFSASPDAGPDDIALLGLALDTVRAKTADDARFAPLVRLGCTLLQRPAGGAEMPDVAAALGRLRDEFAGPDHDAFDALIREATAAEPDPDAARWVRLLRGDGRFGFACHPPIDSADDGRTFHVGPVSSIEEPWLEWQDADASPDADIRVTHALERGRARRVLSRGRPRAGSAEHAAATLEEMCTPDLPTLKSHAVGIRRGIDLERTFPDERSRWSTDLASTIGDMLDEVVALAAGHATAAGRDGSASKPDALRRVFETVVRIGAARGHAVRPAAWSPHDGTTADAVPDADGLAVVFHPTVPAGSVIVDRFGIDGDAGRERRCRRSAGQALEGYDSLAALVATLKGDAPRFEELRQSIADLPRHVLGGKDRLAIPSLYERVWNVLINHPEVTEHQAPWREAIAELIRKPYDMVMFEPAKLGDYPAAWIVGRDGNEPLGRRIARVVRPGVRTLEKKLVWPAIVETE